MKGTNFAPTLTFNLDKKRYPLDPMEMVGKHMTHLGMVCGRIIKAVDKGDFVTVFCRLDKCCKKFIKKWGG